MQYNRLRGVINILAELVLYPFYAVGYVVGYLAGIVVVVALAIVIGIVEGYKRGTGYAQHSKQGS